MSPYSNQSNPLTDSPLKRTITIFGSSRPREGEPAYEVAYQMGKLCARAGWRVCNGGYGGIMEGSARGARENGGTVVGILSRGFAPVGNKYVTESILVNDAIDRLQKLIEMGDAYVILPGGTGTLLELAAVWEFMNKGMMQHKPVVAFGSFWIPLTEMMQQTLRAEGREKSASLVRIARTPQECVELLSAQIF